MPALSHAYKPTEDMSFASVTKSPAQQSLDTWGLPRYPDTTEVIGELYCEKSMSRAEMDTLAAQIEGFALSKVVDDPAVCDTGAFWDVGYEYELRGGTAILILPKCSHGQPVNRACVYATPGTSEAEIEQLINGWTIALGG